MSGYISDSMVYACEKSPERRNTMNPLPIIDPEFKGLIPPLSADERQQLEHNIITEGECREAIILWGKTIIDGHNRYEICTRHGIEFGILEMEFESRDAAKIWILNEQLGRRNLHDAARIEIVLKKAELLKELAAKKLKLGGRGKHRAEKGSPKTTICQNYPNEPAEIDVREMLAKEAGVSNGTFSRYNQIKAEATPQLLEKVQSGEMKIGTAHNLLGKQLIKQLKLAEGMVKFIAKNIPVPCPETNKEIYDSLHEVITMHNQLEGMLKKMNS
jgi:hypothetical protein